MKINYTLLLITPCLGFISSSNLRSKQLLDLKKYISPVVFYSIKKSSCGIEKYKCSNQNVNITDNLLSINNSNTINIIDKIETNTFNYKNFSINSITHSKNENSTEIEVMRYLSFVSSHPNIDLKNNIINTNIFIPIKNKFNSKYKLQNSSLWLKLKKNDIQTKNIGSIITQEILNCTLNSLSKKQKKNYNKKIIIGNDISIPLIPFASLIWLYLPVKMIYTKNNLIIHPIVLQTPANVSKVFGGENVSNSLNIKTISEEQILEWILLKSK